MELQLIAILGLILFVASFVRTAFGFGAGLIAMPLLLLFIDIQIAAPVVAVISITIAFYILISHHKHIDFKIAWKMFVPAIMGVPIGLYFIQQEFQVIVSLILAIIIISFALFKLFQPNIFTLKDDKYSFVFGFLAGILGGAYNVNGPPIIIYGTARRWQPNIFRAYLQAVFFPLNLSIIIGHYFSGNFTSAVFEILLYAIPVLILAILLGEYVHRRIKIERFNKIIYLILLLIGISLLVKIFYLG